VRERHAERTLPVKPRKIELIDHAIELLSVRRTAKIFLNGQYDRYLFSADLYLFGLNRIYQRIVVV
jgi:hypothetical protein